MLFYFQRSFTTLLHLGIVIKLLFL